MLCPLLIAYTLLIYLYSVRILFLQAIPVNEISYLICVYGVVGIATYILAWPIYEQGKLTVRLFCKLFFPALIVPLILLFIAIIQRIYEYGITEFRYAVMLTASWLVGCTVYMIFIRQKVFYHLIRIISGLCILLILASFGPWGAVSISANSQLSILLPLLEEHKILRKGTILPGTKSNVPDATARRIHNIVWHFKDTKKMNLLLEALNLNPSEYPQPRSHNKLLTNMGIKYGSGYTRYASFGNRYGQLPYTNISGYEHLTHVQLEINRFNQFNDWRYLKESGVIDLDARAPNQYFEIKDNRNRMAKFDIISLLKKLTAEKKKYRQATQPPYILEDPTATLPARLIIHYIRAKKMEKGWKLQEIDGFLLY